MTFVTVAAAFIHPIMARAMMTLIAHGILATSTWASAPIFLSPMRVMTALIAPWTYVHPLEVA